MRVQTEECKCEGREVDINDNGGKTREGGTLTGWTRTRGQKERSIYISTVAGRSELDANKSPILQKVFSCRASVAPMSGVEIASNGHTRERRKRTSMIEEVEKKLR